MVFNQSLTICRIPTPTQLIKRPGARDADDRREDHGDAGPGREGLEKGAPTCGGETPGGHPWPLRRYGWGSLVIKLNHSPLPKKVRLDP